MPTARPGSSRRPGFLASLIAVLFAVLGLGMVFHVQLRSGLALAQPDYFDPRLIQYTLERNHRFWFTTQPVGDHFWSPPIFYPEPLAGALTDSMIGLQPFYSPWRWLGADIETAYQLATMGLLLACFATAHRLFRRGLGASPLGASVAAFLFAFALPRSAQLAHSQLFAHYATPLALLGLLRAFALELSAVRRRAGVTMFFGALFVQLLGSFYLTWFLALAVTAGALVAAVVPRLRRPAWQRFRVARDRWFLAGAVAFVAAALVLSPYAAARDRMPPAAFEKFTDALPRAQSFLFGGVGSWETRALGLADWWRIREITIPWEQALSPGLFTLALALWGFWQRRKSPLAGLAAAAVGLTLLLVMRWPGGASLWPVVERLVPGAEAIRVPARVGVLLLLPIGLGISWALEALGRRPRWGRAGLTLAVCLVILEQAQTQASYPKGVPTARADALATVLPAGCASFVYTALVPLHRVNFGGDQLDAMFASLESGVPTLNGYSGYAPGDWWERVGPFLLDVAAPEALPGLAQELVRAGAPPGRLCWLRVALGSQGVRGGTVTWTEPGGTFAHRFLGQGSDSRDFSGVIFADGFESGDLERWTAPNEQTPPFDPGRAWQ
ncbi:MAG: hypothetical protein SF066_09265 [Thermoanaerobaculia bacterium]|nr:hypothetical protein [Thermoanaerobaculia bacterium]